MWSAWRLPLWERVRGVGSLQAGLTFSDFM